MSDNSTSSDEFSTLPISIPPTTIISSTLNDSRSLYLANVPADSTEAHFRAIFSSLVGAGRFESITFDQDKRGAQISHEPAQAERLAKHHKKRKREDEELQQKKEDAAAALPDTWTRELHRSGSSAIALLADEKSVDLVLKAVRKLHKSKKYPIWGEGLKDGVLTLGTHWLKAHNRLSYPGNDVVQAVVDAYFTAFNRKEDEAHQLAKRLRNEPDEDGFVMVTRGSRSAPARRDEAEEAKQRMLEKQQKKKDETQDFYRFQLRERRKAEQMELLKKFDEDRKKVQAMKEKRGKFRPEA
ncbi:hypothetical protein NUW58_g3789 [Xylaria curta]|uniref:Uncharacterized protein n=1 Tax=Xylaria curta TaxID=42375 RepID=A0ACC1PCC4_9PEZI|nr:hypothetical protein NUW58_g3789 [Xylaria curta]